MSKYETDTKLYKFGMTITVVVLGMCAVTATGFLLLTGRTHQTDFMFGIVAFLTICVIAMAIGHRWERPNGDIVPVPLTPVLVPVLPDSDLVYKGHRYEMFEELRQYDAWTS